MAICDNTSVGIIAKKGDSILLLERKKFPYGFAAPAGHVDDHGSFEDAAREELSEETGLEATNLKLLFEERKDNKCRREGGDWHLWKVYEAEAVGEFKDNKDETKQVGWYTKEELNSLAARTNLYLVGKIPEDEWQKQPGLEPIWLEFLKKLGILAI